MLGILNCHFGGWGLGFGSRHLCTGECLGSLTRFEYVQDAFSFLERVLVIIVVTVSVVRCRPEIV